MGPSAKDGSNSSPQRDGYMIANAAYGTGLSSAGENHESTVDDLIYYEDQPVNRANFDNDYVIATAPSNGVDQYEIETSSAIPSQQPSKPPTTGSVSQITQAPARPQSKSKPKSPQASAVTPARKIAFVQGLPYASVEMARINGEMCAGPPYARDRSVVVGAAEGEDYGSFSGSGSGSYSSGCGWRTKDPAGVSGQIACGTVAGQ